MIDDPPHRIRAAMIAARYGITERTAGEWIRRMIAERVLAKRGRLIVGRPSKCDAWVEKGDGKR